MIQYMNTTYKADPKKGFVTASSSRGMMTNVISAVYPDVIAAGPVYSGVAAGGLAESPGFGPATANLDCANGKKIVKTFYPGYNGTYPWMHVWYETADALVFYPKLGQEIKKWSGLDDATWTKNLTTTPQGGYKLMVHGDETNFIAYSAFGVGHTVPVHQDLDLQ
jgi:acetylxylan esterase